MALLWLLLGSTSPGSVTVTLAVTLCSTEEAVTVQVMQPYTSPARWYLVARRQRAEGHLDLLGS